GGEIASDGAQQSSVKLLGDGDTRLRSFWHRDKDMRRRIAPCSRPPYVEFITPRAGSAAVLLSASVSATASAAAALVPPARSPQIRAPGPQTAWRVPPAG